MPAWPWANMPWQVAHSASKMFLPSAICAALAGVGDDAAAVPPLPVMTA